MPVDFSIAWKATVKIASKVVSLLPNIILGFIIFLLFVCAASVAKSLTRRYVERRRTHQAMAILFGRVVQTSIVMLGFLIALSIIAPSFQAADLIKILGIGTVAIGFAFQNILQNFLAGVILLLQEPFRLGDLISVTGPKGSRNMYVFDANNRRYGRDRATKRPSCVSSALYTTPTSMSKMR
jgi:small conductance mechanosensitive channel